MGAAAQGIPAPMPQVQTARAPEVIAAGGGGGYTITLHNSPTIVVDGNRPDDLDQKLEENNRRLLREFDVNISSRRLP